MKSLWLALALLPVAADAGSLYLCKTYGGALFWSQAHCNTHNALIDSIVSVPDTLPFDQQVKLAQQQRQRPVPADSQPGNAVIQASPGGPPATGLPRAGSQGQAARRAGVPAAKQLEPGRDPAPERRRFGPAFRPALLT